MFMVTCEHLDMFQSYENVAKIGLAYLAHSWLSLTRYTMWQQPPMVMVEDNHWKLFIFWSKTNNLDHDCYKNSCLKNQFEQRVFSLVVWWAWCRIFIWRMWPILFRHKNSTAQIDRLAFKNYYVTKIMIFLERNCLRLLIIWVCAYWQVVGDEHERNMQQSNSYIHQLLALFDLELSNHSFDNYNQLPKVITGLDNLIFWVKSKLDFYFRKAQCFSCMGQSQWVW